MALDSQFPTEVIDLPSHGWFYPNGHPLASGRLEIKYMTAKHEDILTSPNLIQKGIVIDKLMEALIADPAVKYDDLLLGDKNALIMASRVLGYGKNYEVEVECPNCNVKNKQEIDLQSFQEKPVNLDPAQKGLNRFKFLLPMLQKTITFRLLTHRDEKMIQQELESLRKGLRSDVGSDVTTRMRYSIVEVEGIDDKADIKTFIENMPARDAMAFREYAKGINPDLDATFDFECIKCMHTERMEVPIGVTFFWPNARV